MRFEKQDAEMAGRQNSPLSWRKDPAILARMNRVEELHMLGWTNAAIAESLPCLESMVCADLRRLNAIWHKRIGDNIQTHRDSAVLHYRRIQRAAWQEFDAVKDTSLNKSAYLNTVKAAEDSITKVLGVEAAQKLALTDPSGKQAASFTITLDRRRDEGHG